LDFQTPKKPPLANKQKIGLPNIQKSPFALTNKNWGVQNARMEACMCLTNLEKTIFAVRYFYSQDEWGWVVLVCVCPKPPPHK